MLVLMIHFIHRYRGKWDVNLIIVDVVLPADRPAAAVVIALVPGVVVLAKK